MTTTLTLIGTIVFGLVIYNIAIQISDTFQAGWFAGIILGLFIDLTIKKNK